MTFLRLILVRIGHLFKSIAALCSRILCFFSRRRDHIGELPYTVVVAKNNPSDISIPERVSTDSVGGWDNQWDTKQTVENKIEQWRSTKIAPPQVQETQEPDFFNDMQPDFKKAKKVILRPKMSSQDSVEKKNLFNYTDDVAVPPATSELGELDDDGQAAWDDDISSTLQEHRLEKHRARQEQHGERMKKKAQKGTTGHY